MFILSVSLATMFITFFQLCNSSQGYTGLGFGRASLKMSLSQNQVEHSFWPIFIEVRPLSRSVQPRYTEDCNFRCFEKARFSFPSTVSQKITFTKIYENAFTAFRNNFPNSTVVFWVRLLLVLHSSLNQAEANLAHG